MLSRTITPDPLRSPRPLLFTFLGNPCTMLNGMVTCGGTTFPYHKASPLLAERIQHALDRSPFVHA